MSTMPRVLRTSVRRLAETLYREGDLHFLYDAAVLPDEGNAAHAELARKHGGEREVRVQHRAAVDGYRLRIGGRIDLLQDDGATLRVCEFKSTRSDVDRLHAHWASVHWAQVQLYAAMLLAARTAPASSEAGADDVAGAVPGDGGTIPAAAPEAAPAHIELALHYVHVDTGRERIFRRTVTEGSLRALLDDACARWIERARALDAWRTVRDAALRPLAFPHPSYRPHQRALAAAAYRAHREGEALLCEAPTGLGKTLSFVFPALKAIGEGHAARLLYLTARSTGQRSALDALDTLDAGGARLRQVQVTARDKVCLTPGAACAGDSCAYARGYHDRLPHALAALRQHAHAWRADVEAVARAHTVCPFALSLAFAREADVVVCDYNYVLDPFIRSARLLAEEARHTSVLIDEAHQLPERAQEMHSATLRSAVFRDAAAGAPRGTRTALRGIATFIEALREAARATQGVLPDAHAVTLDAQCERFTARALPLLTADASASFREAFLQASGWLAVREFVAQAPYTLRAHDDGALQRLCIDASTLVAAALGPFRSVQAFSATLPGGAAAPPLGLPAPHAHWQVPPVFPAENMGTFVLTDIDVTLKSRERTATRVAGAIMATVHARAGNYLVFVPSFAYLQSLHGAFEALLDQEDGAKEVEHFTQRRGSDDAERAEFLARFHADGRTRVGFAVTGGLFGESVDLPGSALIGVVIVGVALAPPTPERDLLRQHLHARGDASADATAYDIPAMVRVRQTAGRLIRSATDRGVLVLVDPRFMQPRFRQWLPAHWQLQALRVDALGAALAGFWARECKDEAQERAV